MSEYGFNFVLWERGSTSGQKYKIIVCFTFSERIHIRCEWRHLWYFSTITIFNHQQNMLWSDTLYLQYKTNYSLEWIIHRKLHCIWQKVVNWASLQSTVPRAYLCILLILCTDVIFPHMNWSVSCMRWKRKMTSQRLQRDALRFR